VLVVAILNIIFGGWGIVFYLMGIVGLFASMAIQRALAGQMGDLFASLERELPGYMVIQFASVGVPLILEVLLVVSGVGLLRVKRWAWLLALAWAGTSLLLNLVALLVTLIWVNPALARGLDQMMAEIAKADPAAQAQLQLQTQFLPNREVQDASAIGTAVVSCVYPIVLLIVLLRPRFRAAVAEWARWYATASPVPATTPPT
jgi:hypothetical protein